METKEIIIDRVLLIGDVLKCAPEAADALFSALDDGEKESLLALLEKLTDRTEELFGGGAQEAPAMPSGEPLPGEAPLGPWEMICTQCELRCRVSAAAETLYAGARCRCGMQMVDAALEQWEQERSEKR